MFINVPLNTVEILYPAGLAFLDLTRQEPLEATSEWRGSWSGAAAPGLSGDGGGGWARPVCLQVSAVGWQHLKSMHFPLQPVLNVLRGTLHFLSPGLLELMAVFLCTSVVLRCGDIATMDRPNAWCLEFRL